MPEANAWIVDVDATTFESQVIERSLQQPVLVDFWAEWCEPCKVLGPLLEKRAIEGNGRFLLAKVNIDRSPELAQAFRVQGIPAVIAVVGGKIADGFEGALPEDQIDEFLARIAGSTRSPEDELLERVRAAVADGEVASSIEVLRAHIAETPAHTAARILLADLLIDMDELDEAGALVAGLDEVERESPEARALAARLAFADSEEDVADLERAVKKDPESIDARMALGRALVTNRKYEAGLEELLEAYRLAAAAANVAAGSTAKKAMLETFETLGLEDPVANDYRFKLSLELFI